MRWVGRLVTSVAAMLLTAGGASGSTTATPVDAAWAAAAASDSLEAYATFVMTYPHSKYARLDYNRLSGLEAASAGSFARPEGTPLFADDHGNANSPGLSPGMIIYCGY